MQLVDISRFLKEGKLKSWPAKTSTREAVRHFLVSFIESDRFYTEKEINQLLNQHHLFNDPALLRRELCDHGLLKRDKFGYKYWKTDFQ